MSIIRRLEKLEIAAKEKKLSQRFETMVIPYSEDEGPIVLRLPIETWEQIEYALNLIYGDPEAKDKPHTD